MFLILDYVIAVFLRIMAKYYREVSKLLCMAEESFEEEVQRLVSTYFQRNHH